MNHASLKTKLEQFYSLHIPDAVLDLHTEQHIPAVDISNLFAAHLSINNAHSGALDKTLSGFVIVEVQGDEYYLYDARDSGRVYCQRHTDRTITVCFESLEAYRASRGLHPSALPITREPKPNKAVSTVALAERYQWAVWFFGRASKEPHEASFEKRWMALAANWFANAIDELDAGKQMFIEERALIHEDIQLAVWWLLVATALADQEWVDDVIRHAPTGNPVFDSFAQALGSLEFSGNLSALPEFKKRRGRFLYTAASPGSKLLDHIYDSATLYRHVRDLTTRSLIIDPHDAFGNKIHTIHVSCEELTDNQYLANLAENLEHNSIQFLLVKSFNALLRGDTSNDEAQRVAQWILANPAKDAWLYEVLPLFSDLAALITDRALVFQASKKLLTLDELHFPLIKLAARVGHEIGSPEAGNFDEIRTRLEGIRPIYTLLIPENNEIEVRQGLALADKLEISQQKLLAKKIQISYQPFHVLAGKWAQSQLV